MPAVTSRRLRNLREDSGRETPGPTARRELLLGEHYEGTGVVVSRRKWRESGGPRLPEIRTDLKVRSFALHHESEGKRLPVVFALRLPPHLVVGAHEADGPLVIELDDAEADELGEVPRWVVPVLTRFARLRVLS